MRGRALLLAMVATGVGLVAFLFLQFRGDGTAKVGVPRAAAACTAGTADCLPRLTLTDTSGVAHSPASLAGKVVVVNVWATWCAPCRTEIPHLAAAYDRYHDRGVVMLGLLADAPSDEALAAFARDHGINYPIVRADPDVMAAFQYPEALPTTFVYDRRGHARLSEAGAIGRGDLDDLLEELLAE